MPLTIPGQPSVSSPIDSTDAAAGVNPAAGPGSAAAGSAAGSAATGLLGALLGGGSVGTSTSTSIGSAGVATVLGTGSAADGSAAAGAGSAALGTSLAVLGTSFAAVGFAVVGAGSAALGTGLAVLGTGSAAVGFAVVGAGSAALGTGLAVLGTGSAAVGFAVVGAGSAALGTGLAVLGTGSAAVGFAVVGAGSAALGTGLAVLGTGSAAVGSVGARVGRVLVKPATTARVAIVVAVAAVALAATVAVPEIALALDNLLPRGLRSGLRSDGIVVSAWILFAAATSVVASAAWPVVSRRNLRQIALVIYGVGVFEVAVNLFWSTTFGWVVVALGCVFIVVTGARNLDWTTLGRGIAIFTAGTAVVAVLAALEVRRASIDAPPARVGEPDWAWPIWAAAALPIAFGAVWIVVELWVRARILLRQIKVLHRVMVGRFPEVVAHEQTGTSAQLEASDQVAQIMDARYLQSGGGVELSPRARHWYRRVRTELRSGHETHWAM
ncbi:hypothetical protein ACQPXH_31225 [Nocardia sp. CA-135953]|uniref:hypothetical protein n=1 Tax=Nocardia sp. CA-135953 TaxID=3239978 RepID=UPI003D95E601